MVPFLQSIPLLENISKAYFDYSSFSIKFRDLNIHETCWESSSNTSQLIKFSTDVGGSQKINFVEKIAWSQTTESWYYSGIRIGSRQTNNLAKCVFSGHCLFSLRNFSVYDSLCPPTRILLPSYCWYDTTFAMSVFCPYFFLGLLSMNF